MPSSRTGNGCEQGSKQEVASDFSAPASILESSECKSSDQNTEENTTDTESTSAFWVTLQPKPQIKSSWKILEKERYIDSIYIISMENWNEKNKKS